MNEIELGVKRRCGSCGTKFYDFFKSPIICPNCGIEFDPEQLLKSRKGRVSSKSAIVEVAKNEKGEDDFQDESLLEAEDLEPEMENVEDDGLPTDEDSFIQVSEDDEEQTATTGFEDDEEFIDDLSGDMEDDEIDGEDDADISSREDEEE